MNQFKHAKWWRSYLDKFMAKLLEAQIHEETKLWSSIVLCQSRSKYARKEQWRRGKTEWRGKQKDSSCSLLAHFWSTSRSPFSTCYIPFQSSGSQESNASNGTRFKVDTKELQPLQPDHSKLKEEFCTAAKSAFCCENFAAILHSARVFSWSFPIVAIDTFGYFSSDIFV